MADYLEQTCFTHSCFLDFVDVAAMFVFGCDACSAAGRLAEQQASQNLTLFKSSLSRKTAAWFFITTVETAYSDHICPGQIDHSEWMIIITEFFSFSLFLMQTTI